MSGQSNERVILIPPYLADAIEWVLQSSANAKGAAPDLSKLTSEQMQVLPLPVAEAFMELTLAALEPPSPPRYSQRNALWSDARTTQRARRHRQRLSALSAARHRLQTWYSQTASARQRGFVK
jgi:hypothetical protein